MNKLQRLILLSVFAFLPLFLNSCVTTILIGTVLMIDHVCFHTESDGGTCGEIVYRIDFTHPDETWMTEKRIAQALRLPKTLALDLSDSRFEWRGLRSYKHIRLDRDLEAEGQRTTGACASKARKTAWPASCSGTFPDTPRDGR